MNIETLKTKLLSQGKNNFIDCIIQSTTGTIEDTFFALYFAKFITEYVELEKAWSNWARGSKKFSYFGSFLLKEKSALKVTDEILLDMTETLDTLTFLMYNYDINIKKTIALCNALYGDLLQDIETYRLMRHQLHGVYNYGTYNNNR